MLAWDDRRDVQDPEVYVVSIIAVLSDFPLWVQRIVADPRSAVLARFSKVYPFVERVRRACEDVYGPMQRAMEFEKRSREQLIERAARERELAAPRIDLKAKYGENYGLNPGPKKQVDDAETIKRRYGVTQEQWDAIPNLPVDHEYWAGVRRCENR